MRRLPSRVVPLSILYVVCTTAIARGQGPALAQATVDRDLAFAKYGTQTLALDLYRPRARNGKLPVVVWIFGGAWMQRNKAGQASTATWLTSDGYAVAVIDYRLSSEALFPAQIVDCKAAVRWLRANADRFGLDADHIGVWGGSSGGHLASLLGVTDGRSIVYGDVVPPEDSSRVQAVVDFFGPTDFLQMDAHALPGAPFKHDAADSPESRLVGGPIQQSAEKAARANPIMYVTKRAPPFFIAHGDADPLVPYNQSELLFDALKRAGDDVTFYKVAGAGHGTSEFDSDVMRGAVRAFLDSHLKPRGSPSR